MFHISIQFLVKACELKKQPFVDAHQKRCFFITVKFRYIFRKTLMLESLLNKVAGLQTFINKRLQHRCFPLNIVKFLRTAFLQNICVWNRDPYFAHQVFHTFKLQCSNYTTAWSPLSDIWRYLTIFGDNFPTIFDDNFKKMSLGSHYIIYKI